MTERKKSTPTATARRNFSSGSSRGDITREQQNYAQLAYKNDDRCYKHFTRTVFANKLTHRPLQQESNFFNVSSSISLTPIRVTGSVYKILASNPSLQPPEIRPHYMMLYHGLLSHTYSLIADQNGLPIDERALSVRPLAVYTTPTKNLSHGTITDLATVPPSAPQGKHIAPQLRVSFGSDSDVESSHAQIYARITPELAYRWKEYEYPENSSRNVYIMHQLSQKQQGAIPVAVAKEATFRSPVDNSSLTTIDIDQRYVHPMIAFLTFFAGTNTSRGSFFTSSTMGKMMRIPKYVPILFQGEDDQGGDDDGGGVSNSAFEKRSELELRREFERAVTVSESGQEENQEQEDLNQVQEQQQQISHTAPAALDTRYDEHSTSTLKPLIVKPISVANTTRYDMSMFLIQNLNKDSAEYTKALRIKYGLNNPAYDNFHFLRPPNS